MVQNAHSRVREKLIALNDWSVGPDTRLEMSLEYRDVTKNSQGEFHSWCNERQGWIRHSLMKF
jgi:hypothetical protein